MVFAPANFANVCSLGLMKLALLWTQSSRKSDSGAILTVGHGKNKGNIKATIIPIGSTKTGTFHRCVPGGIRTPNLLIRSQKFFRPLRGVKVSKKCPSKLFDELYKTAIYKAAGSRIRTDDLLITNQLLYQLSYAGINLGRYSLMRLPRVSFYTPFLYGHV
jgi:hypothetical protein